MNTPTSAPVEIAIPTPIISKGEREFHAFTRLLPTLLPKYQGRFVAIHEEQVVDSDVDDIALIQRVHARFGYVPIYVGLVASPQPPQRLPNFREVILAAQT